MDAEALKRALSEVKIKADHPDLADVIEKARVRSEITKLQAEYAKLKQEELVRTAMQQSHPTPKGQSGPAPFGTRECLWCGKVFSMFSIAPLVKDSDERPFCSDVCMVSQVAFDHAELQAGLDYVKRSLGTEEEIA